MNTHEPLALYTDTVRKEWIDYNGHMNVAYYVLAFDYATDAFLEFLGLDTDLRERFQVSTFAAESHVTYQRELKEADPMRLTTQVLGFDSKRIHYFHRMFHAEEGFLAATLETLSLCMDMRVRRVGRWPPDVLKRIEPIAAGHAKLDQPRERGHAIGTPLPLAYRGA